MGDKVHPTHFQVPEMPYKRKEQEATLLCQQLISIWDAAPNMSDKEYIIAVAELLAEKAELVDWVMKYKGE